VPNLDIKDELWMISHEVPLLPFPAFWLVDSFNTMHLLKIVIY